MHSFTRRFTAVLATLTATVQALDGIVAPSQVTAGQEFEVTFQDANSDEYRVYLAAALAGVNGNTCYLINSTTLSDSVNVTVPADVGPSANYYSIAIADLTTGQASTFSNRFNFTGATGNYSEYENALGGSPFWSADDLPCSAYSCARDCAQDGYPEDLTNTTAFNTMKSCILDCNGVTPAASQTAPAHVASSTSTSTSTSGTETGNAAASTTSSAAAADNKAFFAGAAAAGFAGLAFLL